MPLELNPPKSNFNMPKLKELRLKRHLTQQQLAEKAEITQTTINRLEARHHKPSDLTLQRLADALGVEPHEIEF
jgi:transcriptional regulator with XRE-family HTH domain